MAALLFGAVIAAYSPALAGGMLWDDAGHVTRPDLQSLGGLWRIWTQPGATQQYYPLLHSAFWVEHRLWGDAVVGYHLVNVLLHALSACLLAAIVRALRLRGAWLAGFLFALHPVCVEAVAWIAEQKSALSGAFYLGAALCYLHFDRSRRPRLYWWASALFVLALASKTVTATLPAALLMVLWWRRGKLEWKRDVAPLVPWLAAGAAAGAVTAYVEARYIGAQGTGFALTFGQRCLLAGRALWFYFGKIIWPVDLTFLYRRWTVNTADLAQYVFPLGVVAVGAALLWLAFRHRERGPLAAFLVFAGTLFPALGFFNVYPFLYSYVADHFQYLASIALIVPAAALLTSGLQRAKAPGTARVAAAGVLPAILALLTWRQSGIYRDSRTLYEATLARNPDCWLAHNNLADELLREPGELNEAIAHLESALRLQPDYPQTYNTLGIALANVPGRLPEAIRDFETAVRIEPEYFQAQNNLGLALSRFPERRQDAAAHFQAALRTKPDYAEAHNNLGSLLSQDPTRLADAIAEYREALRIDADYAAAHYNLANALADAGRGREAIGEYRETLRLQPGNAQAHNNLGIMLSALPDHLADAIGEFQAALRIAPDFAGAHYNLAVALAKAPDRRQDAMAECEAALRIDPTFEPARKMLERLRAAAPAARRTGVPGS